MVISKNAIENIKLYQAQIDAYQAVRNYCEQFSEFKKREALVLDEAHNVAVFYDDSPVTGGCSIL
ncbi:hypothetical protein [Lysinibacillus sp. 54212]|uniref:hypothetical protein n=1 Tax=Lysinibacillus sp. 54212 TaxID=3119829 RepID=UPI002FC7ED46